MLPPQIALLLSTTLGVLFNFATYGRVAFDRRFGWASFFRFVAVYVILYGINVVLLRVLLNLGHSPYIAQLILLIPMTGGAFLAQRYFVFRSGAKAPPEIIRS
jgi:putative flippase GtrA